MFSFLTGSVAERVQDSPKGDFIVVDTHGVGFEVRTSSRSIRQCPAIGEPVRLFTSLLVREDALTLIGFISREERDLFNILQGASGVGAKVALSLLSALTVSDIAQAVVSEQYKALTQAKGVGGKLAQKIVLDLKEKMAQWRTSDRLSAASLSIASFQPAPAQAEAFQEAEGVLLSLGYQPEEILQGFKNIPDNGEIPSSEIILRDTLRWLAQSV